MMKSRLKFAMLKAAAAAVAVAQMVSLRSASFGPGITIDEKAGIIKNAAVLTIGPAAGHGFSIDATTLEQVRALGVAKPNGVPVRFTHPDKDDPNQESLGTDVGYIKNLRIEGNSLRGDIHLAAYAEVLPGLGNVKAYLLSKAKDDPTGFGLSIVFGYVTEPLMESGHVIELLARANQLEFVDFVARPAANPNGLLSTKPKSTFKSLKAKTKFRSLCGCDPYISYATLPMPIGMGDRVTVKPGMSHDDDDAGVGGTVLAIGTSALGVLFDGDDAMTTWYTEAELQREPAAVEAVAMASKKSVFRSKPAGFKSLKK